MNFQKLLLHQRIITKKGNVLNNQCLNTAARCRMNLNTLGPLAIAFNKPTIEPNREFLDANTGLFEVPELQNPNGFHILKENVLSDCDRLIPKTIDSHDSPGIVSLFDEISDRLCKVADLAEFVRLTHPNKEFSEAAEQTSLELGGYVEMLNTNLGLYEALKNALDAESVRTQMDSVTEYVGRLFLFDFEQSGIHLEEQKRQRAVSLHETILTLGAQFTHGASAPTELPLRLWPWTAKVPFDIVDKKIHVTSPYLDSKDAKLRELVFKSYMKSSHEQNECLEYLLSARYQLARLLGFNSFGDRTLVGTMAGNPDNTINFINDALEMLEKPSRNDIETIQQWKARDEAKSFSEVHMWDVRYYTNHITTETCKLPVALVAEYFSIGSCMEGLDNLFRSLYGTRLSAMQPEQGEVWSPDVKKLAVVHESEGTLGYIYCDFFSRPGKISQDCHFTIRGGKQLPDGSYQHPIVCLVCNFPASSSNTPSLLSIGMVENLFHEMGHAMHSMLARTKYQHTSGTRCATDFAEVPSILMEFFASDPRVLKEFAKHYKTGQPLPDELLQKISQSKTMFSALEMKTQGFYALVDQRYHGTHPLGKSITDVMADIQNKRFCVPYVPGTAWHHRFTHFYSYGAKYYSYLWSKAVASSVWLRFFKEDPFSRTAGERYRRTMLAHGSAKPPNILVKDMLSEEVTTKDLVRALESDLVPNS